MKRSLLGDIELTVVESEEPTYSNKTTDNPVDKGVSMTDHSEPDSLQVTIKGVVTGSDAEKKRNKLIFYRNNSTMLTFTGTNIYTSMIIQNFVPTKDSSISNGFKFSITLKQIRVATSKNSAIIIKNLNIQNKSKGLKTFSKKPVGSQAKADFLWQAMKSSLSSSATKNSATKPAFWFGITGQGGKSWINH